MYKGVIDDQGRTNKRCTVTDTVPTLRSESHGNQPKAVLEVEVKEATSKGYAIARGGARCSQLHNAREQDKKGKSRSRYGEHIRHKLQSGNLR